MQGVVYDPMGVTFAALSTDRCLRIYSSTSHKCINNVNKIQLVANAKEPAANTTLASTTTAVAAAAAATNAANPTGTSGETEVTTKVKNILITYR